MIHPIPSGTRDVLPDELRELRAITERIRGVFDAPAKNVFLVKFAYWINP